MTAACTKCTRLRWRVWLGVMLLTLADGMASAADIESVDGMAMTVSDLARAERFFTEVLGFRLERRFERSGREWETLYALPGAHVSIARLRLGEERLDLMAFSAAGRPIASDAAANDRGFQHVAIVVDDMAAAYARLREHGVRHASSAPQRLPASIPAAAGIEAFYFRDPDGHFLELLHFPDDKGDARWHGRDGPRFRGLDHSAIVVASTERALAFWRDVLGLRVAGSSENQGYEQEHLNNVFGAHLIITGLRAAHGPGVELLHYLAPDNGRAAPDDARVNDVWHWQIELRAASREAFERLEAALRAHGYRALSAAPVELPATAAAGARAQLWCDADGHAVLITSP